MNIFVIDKDTNTAEIIRSVAENLCQTTNIRISQNQDDTLNLILKNTPDIIFFNMDSTEINLSEFLFEINQYCDNKPTFIALSNSKSKAYGAFKFDFFDFLLKPLTELSVRKSLLKYRRRLSLEPCETICLKSYKDYQYLNTNEIMFLKADNNTTDFYMEDGTIIGAYKTLKVFENTLPQNFLRIHKSYIINSNCISRIHYGKSMCSIRNNDYKIPFTKTFINNIDLINTVLLKNKTIVLN